MKKMRAPLLLASTFPVLLLSISAHSYFDFQRVRTYSGAFLYLDIALYLIKAALFVVAAIEVAKAPKTLFTKLYTLVAALFMLLMVLLVLPVPVTGGLYDMSLYFVNGLGYGGVVSACAYYIVLSTYSLTGKKK